MIYLIIAFSCLMMVQTFGQTPVPLTPAKQEAIRTLEDQVKSLNETLSTMSKSQSNYEFMKDTLFMEQDQIDLIKGGYSPDKASSIALLEVCLRALIRNPNDSNIHSSKAELQSQIDQLKNGPKE